MPTINLPKKKIQKGNKKVDKQKNLNHSSVYNTSIWRKLRLEKLKLNPLCERCFQIGKISSGIDVHHKVPISTGRTKQEKQRLGFNIDNLETLCKQCHIDEHTQK